MLVALHADEVPRLHGQLVAALTFLTDTVPEVLRLVRVACPNPAALKLDVKDMSPTQVSASGYCVSCWRDNGYLNPITLRANGERRYRDHCNWCGEWAAAHDGREPPLRLLELHHQGVRLTKRIVDEIVAADDAARRDLRRANRAKNKKRRKGR
jgi:hypothetical protein